MVLHRIDDAARALSTEPHRGFLLKALQYAPEGETLATVAARVLHRELLPFSVARNVVDPEGLLLVELDPQGVAVNVAMLTLRPGSAVFPKLLVELMEWGRALGFHRLEGVSRRPGMARHLFRFGWEPLGPMPEMPGWFRYCFHELYMGLGNFTPTEPPTLADLPEGFPFFRGDE